MSKPTDGVPFYPARPSNGGMDFPSLCQPGALYSGGDWLFEPKFNGWRGLLHAPSGTMWNRKGGRLSIVGEFDRAIDQIRAERTRALHSLAGEEDHGCISLVVGEADWFDVEALERRHARGKGCLVVIDMPLLGVDCERRGKVLRTMFPPAIDHCAERDSAYSIPSYTDGPAVWRELQDNNHMLGDIVFYEGVVAKRRHSMYPLQLFNPEKETTDWIKHRFTTK